MPLQELPPAASAPQASSRLLLWKQEECGRKGLSSSELRSNYRFHSPLLVYSLP
jgi:hypothetical protein